MSTLDLAKSDSVRRTKRALDCTSMCSHPIGWGDSPCSDTSYLPLITPCPDCSLINPPMISALAHWPELEGALGDSMVLLHVDGGRSLSVRGAEAMMSPESAQHLAVQLLLAGALVDHPDFKVGDTTHENAADFVVHRRRVDSQECRTTLSTEGNELGKFTFSVSISRCGEAPPTVDLTFEGDENTITFSVTDVGPSDDSRDRCSST